MEQTLNIIKAGKRRIEVEYNGAKYKLNKFGVAFAWSDTYNDYALDLNTPYSLHYEIQDLLVKRGATYTHDKWDRLFDYTNVK